MLLQVVVVYLLFHIVCRLLFHLMNRLRLLNNVHLLGSKALRIKVILDRSHMLSSHLASERHLCLGVNIWVRRLKGGHMRHHWVRLLMISHHREGWLLKASWGWKLQILGIGRLRILLGHYIIELSLHHRVRLRLLHRQGRVSTGVGLVEVGHVSFWW